MAKVKWSAGIEYVSGALCKCGKHGHHRHTRMLLATHRVAATTATNCNNVYLRDDIERTTAPSTDELFARVRFTAVADAGRTRSKDLSKISQDQQAFIAQKDLAGGKKTMRSYLWSLELAAYDASHAG